MGTKARAMSWVWFRASAEQEPVVLFSCVLGGLGEGHLARTHCYSPSGKAHPRHDSHAPASCSPPLVPKPSSSHIPNPSAPTSKVLPSCRQAHMQAPQFPNAASRTSSARPHTSFLSLHAPISHHQASFCRFCLRTGAVASRRPTRRLDTGSSMCTRSPWAHLSISEHSVHTASRSGASVVL